MLVDEHGSAAANRARWRVAVVVLRYFVAVLRSHRHQDLQDELRALPGATRATCSMLDRLIAVESPKSKRRHGEARRVALTIVRGRSRLRWHGPNWTEQGLPARQATLGATAPPAPGGGAVLADGYFLKENSAVWLEPSLSVRAS